MAKSPNRFKRAKEWLKNHPEIQIEWHYCMGYKDGPGYSADFYIENKDGTRSTLCHATHTYISKYEGTRGRRKGVIISGVKQLERIYDLESFHEADIQSAASKRPTSHKSSYTPPKRYARGYRDSVGRKP